MSANERPAPTTEAGPPENIATTAPLAPQSKGTDDGSALVVHFPLSWARALIDNADGPIPEYGSGAWSALPDQSRTKVASTVVAAEKWRTCNREVGVHTLPRGRRARDVVEARRPRPGDYMGGPVSWERDEAASRD